MCTRWTCSRQLWLVAVILWLAAATATPAANRPQAEMPLLESSDQTSGPAVIETTVVELHRDDARELHAVLNAIPGNHWVDNTMMAEFSARDVSRLLEEIKCRPAFTVVPPRRQQFDHSVVRVASKNWTELSRQQEFNALREPGWELTVTQSDARLDATRLRIGAEIRWTSPRNDGHEELGAVLNISTVSREINCDRAAVTLLPARPDARAATNVPATLYVLITTVTPYSDAIDDLRP
jgi:hypothetical protein